MRKKTAAMAAIVWLSLAALAAAQPAETCVGADLTSADMLPFSDSFPPSSDDFTMTGTGCVEQGIDSVVCFQPMNDCSVQVSCLNDGGLQSVNIVTGPCTVTPASCVASDTGTEPMVVVALTAGENVCVVCEFSDPNFTFTNITETAGSCGSLPVTLEHFSIDDPKDDEARSTGDG